MLPLRPLFYSLFSVSWLLAWLLLIPIETHSNIGSSELEEFLDKASRKTLMPCGTFYLTNQAIWHHSRHLIICTFRLLCQNIIKRELKNHDFNWKSFDSGKVTIFFYISMISIRLIVTFQKMFSWLLYILGPPSLRWSSLPPWHLFSVTVRCWVVSEIETTYLWMGSWDSRPRAEMDV